MRPALVTLRRLVESGVWASPPALAALLQEAEEAKGAREELYLRERQLAELQAEMARICQHVVRAANEGLVSLAAVEGAFTSTAVATIIGEALKLKADLEKKS